MIDDHKCTRCGATLKIVAVKVPVYKAHQTAQREAIGAPPLQSLVGFQDREEVAECQRCTGAY